MCCGKMIKFPNEKERAMLTTKDITVDLDKTGEKNDNNKKHKRKPR